MKKLEALAKTSDFPIITDKPVHNGKVRSVYMLSDKDSSRIIQEKGYDIHPESGLAVMITSDRISAFDCNWTAEGLDGVPLKGSSLNAISKHWFDLFKEYGLADHHIVDTPHPLVWIVRVANALKVEGIARQYITGSMWRDYEKGQREFGGITLPDGLKRHQKLDDLLVTPSTKGTLHNIPGILEQEDVNINTDQIMNNYEALGFRSIGDIGLYEDLLKKGFNVISEKLYGLDMIFVDTKFEFGYVSNKKGDPEMIYIDEVGTPDSSRIWDKEEYLNGNVVERSKEPFRQFLLENTDRNVMLDKNRMDERKHIASTYKVPIEEMIKLSKNYSSTAELIIGSPLLEVTRPREEIIDTLNGYSIIR